MYCQSTFLDAHAKLHQPLLPGVSKYAVKAPTINFWGSHVNSGLSGFPLYCQSTFLDALKSHINRCCRVSPNMLSKHQKSWGSLLSKYQHSEGVSNCTVKVPTLTEGVTSTVLPMPGVPPIVLSEYQRLLRESLEWTVTVGVSKYAVKAPTSYWGSYTCCLGLFPRVLLGGVSPVF